MADMVGREIVKRIAVIGDKNKSVTKQLNLISWNNKEPKLDLRSWSEDGERAYRGLTLTYQEARDLRDALVEYFKGKSDE